MLTVSSTLTLISFNLDTGSNVCLRVLCQWIYSKEIRLMEEISLTLRLRDGSKNVFTESSKAGDLPSLIESIRTVQRLSNQRLTELVEQEKASQASCKQTSAPCDDVNNDYISASDEDGSS